MVKEVRYILTDGNIVPLRPNNLEEVKGLEITYTLTYKEAVEQYGHLFKDWEEKKQNKPNNTLNKD